MARYIIKLNPLIFAFVAWASHASAENVKIECGADGRLDSIQAQSAATKFSVDPDYVDPFRASQELANSVCGTLSACQDHGPVVNTLVKNILLSLGKNENGQPASCEDAVYKNMFSNSEFNDPFLGVSISRNSGINKNKSGNYQKNVLRQAAEQAILDGVDPYLAMAVSIIENPQLVPSKKEADVKTKSSILYNRKYGVVPVDSIGAFTALGCLPEGRTAVHKISQSDANSVKSELAKINLMEKNSEAQKKLVPSLPSSEQQFLGSLEDRIRLNQEIKEGQHDLLRWQVQLQGSNNISQKTKLGNAIQVERGSLQFSQGELDELDKLLKTVSPSPQAQKIAILIQELGSEEGHLNNLENAIVDKFADDADKIEAAAELTCAEDADCMGVIRKPSKVEEYDFSNLSGIEVADVKARTVCNESQVVSRADGSHLSDSDGDGDESGNGRCCAKVKGPSPATPLLNAALGIRYLKDQIQSCITGGGKSLSYCIQKYNGMGCLGCTEKFKNDCFHELDLATHPIYGARVADMALAGLMSNDDINQLVAQAVKQVKKPATSMFCIGAKPGIRNLDSTQFLAEQRRDLGGRSSCDKYFK